MAGTTRHGETMRGLYDYWSERFFELAEGPHRITLHNGKATEVHKLMAAVIGLLREMKADGHLAYDRTGDDFTVDQLAAFMHVAKATAVSYLDWLRREGCMTERPQRSDMGHPMTSTRSMVDPRKPETPGSALSAELNLGATPTLSSAKPGPKFSEAGSQVQSPISTLTYTQETGRPRRRRSVVSDDALLGVERIEGSGFLWEADPEPDEVTGHPAYLSRDAWQQVLSALGWQSMFRTLSKSEPPQGMTLRVQVVGSQTLVFWTRFKYSSHRARMQRDAPEVRSLVRELLGDSIIVEFRDLTELDDVEPVFVDRAGGVRE